MRENDSTQKNNFLQGEMEMSGKRGQDFWDLDIYRRYEALSETLWTTEENGRPKHQHIIGYQMLRAVDSIGANIAESVGRGHLKESLHHLYYARGSLQETQHWIRVAVRRNLISVDDTSELRNTSVVLGKQLNSFIRSQHPKTRAVSRSPEPGARS